ncbi:cysteine proteinase [Rhizophagus irregularis]|nr:cysteine proteinase [Rhizophagus irregularis]
MPELGCEIEDFKYNTWHVTNWRNLEKRITGPKFEVGSWEWQILLFPFGNNNLDSVSIYLDFFDPKSAPDGWHLCVQFALVLWNPEDPSHYVAHHSHHRFNAEESDWGFTRFYGLDKLFTPYENRTRPLIENDSTNITALVRVLKDPTGVLWHDYNSNMRKGYVGLNNQGATSYINSLLQSLYFTTYFRKAVYQIPTENDIPNKSVPLALQRVFYNLQTSDIPIETIELTKSFGWNSFDSFTHHDVHEFNRMLQNYLEGKMKGTKADGAITKLFSGKMKSYIKCVNQDYESSYVEDYYDIQLNVKGCKTLRDSFKNYIQKETLEDDNKYQAEGYGLQVAEKGVIFESFPPVLHLQLKRFEYDMQKNAMTKINDRYEFPIEIDLEEFLSENADRSNPHKYLLYGIIVHSGDLHEGHYFALLKPEKDGKWFKFDDGRVTPVMDSEVLDSYGGEFPDANSISAIDPTDKRSRSTNAYMLIYIRESSINEILSPVIPEDIPDHLQRRSEEERAFDFIIKIVTAEKFKYHQGFDIANFEYPISDIYTYKTTKNKTYEVFKKNISRTFKIPLEQMRFWYFVNRRNGTIRPDSPIPESYLDLSMEKIHAKITCQQNKMKLYMEVADKPIYGERWFPPIDENYHIMVFIKYFDVEKQALEGLGHLYLRKFSKVSDYTCILCEKKGFPSHTPLKIYEEVRPDTIVEMKLRSTFQQSDIQNGDIICFQKVLTEKEYVNQEHTIAGRSWNIPHFYESLTLRIVVSFKPRWKYQNSKHEFDLILNKKWTYDQLTGVVSIHLNTDPLKLRFTTASFGTPKDDIKHTTTQTISEMFQTANLTQSAHILFYEMLDVSIVELEAKKFLKVAWLGNTVREKEVIGLCLKKHAIVSELIRKLLRKVILSSQNSKIRLFEVVNHKIQKEYTETEPIEKIQEFAKLYAEEIPQDEIFINKDDRIIQAFHFTNDPICVHGIPFKFVIKNGETLSDTKERLQYRFRMNVDDFLKIKIAIIPGTSYVKPEYLEDDDIILSEKIFSDEDYLGLDHVHKTCHVEEVGDTKKAIFIRN